MDNDKKILNYYDCLLRQSDINLILSNSWLNDNLINFYFEYLNKDIIIDKPILCVCPEVTQLIKLSNTDTIKDLTHSLEFSLKNYIFFALNDFTERLAAGGSHWSLFIINTMKQQMYHLDSSTNMNLSCAKIMVKKFQTTFNKNMEFKSIPVLNQENSYDCGIHVICNAHHIIEHLIKTPLIDISDIPPCPIELIRSKRKNLKILIEKLSHEYQSLLS